MPATEMRPILYQIVAEHLMVDPMKVTDDATFESLDADSLDIVEIQIKVEDRFKLPMIDDKAFLEIKTVGDMAKVLEGLRSGT